MPLIELDVLIRWEAVEVIGVVTVDNAGPSQSVRLM